MDKKSAKMLILGGIFILLGLGLFIYSLYTHSELQNLENTVDFEEIQNNYRMSTNDKYLKYLKNADFLNQKIKQNKSLLIKRTACVYLDYAYYNANEFYEFAKDLEEEDKKNAALGNVRMLQNSLKDYTVCKNYNKYSAKIQELFDSAEKEDLIKQQNKENMMLLKQEQELEDNSAEISEQIDSEKQSIEIQPTAKSEDSVSE